MRQPSLVDDRECVELLRWALPRMELRWEGFRKVRRQVCRRIGRRLKALGLSGVEEYRARLESVPEEWAELDALCRVTISRFHRDRGVFEHLARSVLPELAADAEEGRAVRAWSAGCASGEEPYTLALAWELEVRPAFQATTLEILATDVDETVLRRARAAAYGESSLRELPEHWRRRGFVRRGGRYHLRPRFRSLVTFARHDVRDPAPAGPFDLVLCRNLAFTYFSPEAQARVAREIAGVLRPGGALVVGSHEGLSDGIDAFEPWHTIPGIYRRRERGRRSRREGATALGDAYHESNVTTGLPAPGQ